MHTLTGYVKNTQNGFSFIKISLALGLLE